MNLKRLRKRGWSEQEIRHLLRILKRAEKTKHPRLKLIEHLVFWAVIFALGCGAVAISLELLPFILLSSMVFVVPVMFVVGTCLGLLLVHVLHDLKLERTHQHVGVAVLLTISITMVTFILGTLQERLGSVHTSGMLVTSLIFSAGILVPYLVHWRIVHESA